MKIVYIAGSIIPSPSANSIHVMKMCQALAELGHDVTLLVPDKKDEIEKGVQNIFKYYGVNEIFKINKLFSPGIRLFGPFIYSLLIALRINKLKPDITVGRYIFGCTFSALAGYPVIYDAHSTVWEVGKIDEYFFKALVRSKNFIKLTVISNALKRLYVKRNLLNDNKILVIPNGSDEPSTKERIKSWPGRKNRLQIAYIGALYQGKGVEVIEAVAPEIPGVDFHIIGGKERDILYWKDRIKRDNVFFHGYISQEKITGYLNMVDVCLLPNQKEVLTPNSRSGMQSHNIGDYTSPLKMFNYMAHKKPIIASKIPVIEEILNENNAMLVNADDFNGWIDAIKILRKKSIRKKLGQQAYIDYKSNYTWIKRAEKMLEG